MFDTDDTDVPALFERLRGVIVDEVDDRPDADEQWYRDNPR